MTREKRPTGRMETKPASRPSEPVRMIVEYDDADDFLGDYAANLSSGTTFIQISRELELDRRIQLVLTFSGLLEPIVVDAVARKASEGPIPGVSVELLATSAIRLATAAQRIEARDPKLVVPVVKVLIVEDNHHIAELVRSGLAASARRDLGHVAFTFETAEDGASALEKFSTQPFDAAIVDLYLPVLDGSQLIQQVRTRGLTLPIITMSGGGDSARNAALRAGATVFLDKPVRLRSMLDTMRQLLNV